MSRTIFDIHIDDLSDKQLERLFRQWLKSEDAHLVATPNPEMLLHAKNDADFTNTLQSMNLLLADGIGVIYASHALHDEPIHHRHTGVDTLDTLASLAVQEQSHMLFFGGASGSAARAAEVMEQRHPGLSISAIDPGPISSQSITSVDPYLLRRINHIQPNIIAVALGHGKQERFLKTYSPHIPSLRMGIGIGGAFEMIGGDLKRSPSFLQGRGLEWIWRLLQQPRRIKRIWRACIVFPYHIVRDTVRANRLLRGTHRVFQAVFTTIHR